MIDIELWEKRKKQLGLTFDDLSKLSGIPKRTILGVFRKEVLTPRIDTVQAIEAALGLSKTESVSPAVNDLTDNEKRLLKAFNSLIEPMQEYVLEMIEKLVSQPQNVTKRA